MTKTTYEDACGRGYDGPPPKRRPRGCGGYASWSGHCGAPDCPDCYPSTWDETEDDYDDEALKVVSSSVSPHKGRRTTPGEPSNAPRA